MYFKKMSIPSLFVLVHLHEHVVKLAMVNNDNNNSKSLLLI